jgi:2-methylcitrate dehydratase PrpD
MEAGAGRCPEPAGDAVHAGLRGLPGEAGGARRARRVKGWDLFDRHDEELDMGHDQPADRLAAFVADLTLDALPGGVVPHAVAIVRDTLGVLLAGVAQPESAGLATAAADLGGPGPATVAGSGVRTVAHVAALANATAAVTLELDEGNQFAVNHPSVHVLPAALAVAEERGSTGAQLLEAFIAGYEAAVRTGAATRLRDAVHPFGTTAIVGAAAAAAKLHGLDATGIAAVLRLAAGMTIASSQSAANAGATVRNLGTGLTAHNGVLAVALHRLGHTGEPLALERVFGMVLGSGWDEHRLGGDPAGLYITRNYFKLHACSRWNHAPIEATAELMAGGGFTVADVERVVVATYDPAVRLAGHDPANGYAAKHSIPYNVAARMVLGTNGLEAYTDEAVADPGVRDLAARVVVREDPELTARLPEVRAARVEVTLTDGRVLSARVDTPPGGFDNPYDESVLLDKLRRLAARTLDEARIDRLLAACDALPVAPDVTRLAALLTAG